MTHPNSEKVLETTLWGREGSRREKHGEKGNWRDVRIGKQEEKGERGEKQGRKERGEGRNGKGSKSDKEGEKGEGWKMKKME